MIEVDTARRNFSHGAYDPVLFMGHHPLHGGHGVPHMDSQRVLVHWNHSAGNLQPTPAAPVPTSGAKSEEEADDDDEDRPFTPPPPRERLSYTRYQLELLNGIYEEVRYPNSTQKQLIAKRVGITREQVKIWFQNRRRKDVIGNAGKSKACDTSISSTGSSKDSDQQNSPAPDVAESSSSEDSTSLTDSGECVVPAVVMKSVIGELKKFTNDPLKGKKNRKKAKAKQKEKTQLKKNLASTLLAANYDMISPPNQITPTAFFEKVRSGFNHSKNASAFACPRDSAKPSSDICVSNTLDNATAAVPGKTVSDIPKTVDSNRQFPPPASNNINGPLHSFTGDLPVLGDMLGYKSSLDSRPKDLMPPTAAQLSSALPNSPLHRGNTDNALPTQSLLNSFSPGRHINGLYHYPFLAEQPMLLSSLRHSDHIFRPAPQYPLPPFGEDPYQPLFISSLSNPYYSPPSATWQPHAPATTSTYGQI